MHTVAKLFMIILLGLLLSAAVSAKDILVNQAGYLSDKTKEAYFIGTVDSFRVLSWPAGSVQFAGRTELTAANDAATGLRVAKGDFTPLTAQGTYVIVTSRGDTSAPFPIGTMVFDDVYRKSLKGFYYQRCGVALGSTYAGAYAHPACHMHDAVYHATTGMSGSKSTLGGWHDAGDYGKYVVNAGVSVGTLMLAFEMFPQRFSQDDLNIPESGNGVADFLDEVRFELDWLLTMQDTADGGVYFKVTTTNFDDFEMPEKDVATRYIYEKSTTATGDFAAMMAQAARVYAPFDSNFAARCLAAARLSWQYLLDHPSIVPSPMGFRNPPGTATGGYGDGHDLDERLWAAAELYETTGEGPFDAYFRLYCDEAGVFRSAMSWSDLSPLADLAYLLGKQAGASSQVRLELKKGLIELCDALVARASEDGFNVTLRPRRYAWGSNSDVLNNAVLLIVGHELTGNASYYTTALEQLNYILGCNCKDVSYLTDVGTRSPMHIHHRPSGADGVEAPVPGLLAGGPDGGRHDPVLRSTYTGSTPAAQCYLDDQGSYASNEICINWNSPLVFVAGYFGAGGSGMRGK